MKLNLAIVEDDSTERSSIEGLLDDMQETLDVKFNITSFPSAEAFLFEHEAYNIYDILLLDIEMGEISGIELAKRIRSRDSRAEIIFITSHFELTGEGYEVDARHFLIKPVKTEKLCKVMSRAISHLSVEPPSVLIRCDGESLKLSADSILFAESFLHYTIVHTEDGEYKIKEGLSVFAEKLGTGFFKIHRSYVVSLSRIVRISRTEVTLDTGASLPLARGSYDAVNRAFIEQN